MSAPDRDVVVRDVRRGEREAFGQLVQGYQDRLFGLVLMMVRQPAAVQDAFVRGVHTPPSLRRQPSLLSVAGDHRSSRLAQNRLRRHGRTVRLEGPSLESAKEPAATAGALTALITNERSRGLWEAVAALPSGERTALIPLLPRRHARSRRRACPRGHHRLDLDAALPGEASSTRASRAGDYFSPGVIDMTCAHVLGLIDAGPFADYPRAHLESAWQHGRQCTTCGPAMEAATSLTMDLAALPQVAASPELTAAILARIARAEQRQPAPVSATMPAIRPRFITRDWSAWATTLAGLAVGLVTILSVAHGGGVAMNIVSPRVGGMTGLLVAMPSTTTDALVLVSGLVLYAAGLFAPLRELRS